LWFPKKKIRDVQEWRIKINKRKKNYLKIIKTLVISNFNLMRNKLKLFVIARGKAITRFLKKFQLFLNEIWGIKYLSEQKHGTAYAYQFDNIPIISFFKRDHYMVFNEFLSTIEQVLRQPDILVICNNHIVEISPTNPSGIIISTREGNYV
jgi:hypothetical protein